MALGVRRGVFVGLGASLLLVTALVAWVGWRGVVQAGEAIGWTGFAAFTGYWLFVLTTAGLAWAAAAPGAPGDKVCLFVWGRFLRESAAEVLPVSQVGGLFLGARAVMAGGVAEEVALASTVVDLTAEIAAQAIYTLLGVGLILLQMNTKVAGLVLWPAVAGFVLLLASLLAFVLGHGPAVGALARLAGRWLPDSGVRADAVTAEVERIFRMPGRMSLAVALHVAGWVGGGGASWIALRFMGAEVPFWAVIAVESLMYAVRNLGFALPGALGVQEGAYVILGPMFGVQASEALALSLLRRARDLTIGVPVLVAWQVKEGRALLRRRPAKP